MSEWFNSLSLIVRCAIVIFLVLVVTSTVEALFMCVLSGRFSRMEEARELERLVRKENESKQT